MNLLGKMYYAGNSEMQTLRKIKSEWKRDGNNNLVSDSTGRYS